MLQNLKNFRTAKLNFSVYYNYSDYIIIDQIRGLNVRIESISRKGTKGQSTRSMHEVGNAKWLALD